MKEIRLSDDLVALVDDADYPLMSSINWKPLKTKCTVYAWATVGGKTTYLHRLIMEAPRGKQVDHVNHNGLDNRRENLRIVTQSQNNANTRVRKDNTTGFKGVHFDKWAGRYQAYIGGKPKLIHLGRFDTAKEAALAYNKAAIRMFGEHAFLNKV